MFEPGDSFDGWRVEARLGRRTLRCRRETDRARVAALWACAPEHSRSREPLLRRLQALGGLEHPHLARTHAPRDRGEVLYLEAELVTGPSLAERPVSWASLASLADALAAVHARGTFHGDLRPSRVRLPDRAVLVGFGLAPAELAPRELPSSTPERWRYLPPEGPGPEGDIYALGQLLYEQLTGRSAFASGGPAEVERAKRQIPTLDPGGLHLPALREWIRRATSLDPARRPSASELSLGLQQLLPDRSVAVRMGGSSISPSRAPQVRAVSLSPAPPRPQVPPGPALSHETRFERLATARSLAPTEIRPRRSHLRGGAWGCGSRCWACPPPRARRSWR
jgi:serine/threonine protein kinase